MSVLESCILHSWCNHKIQRAKDHGSEDVSIWWLSPESILQLTWAHKWSFRGTAILLLHCTVCQFPWWRNSGKRDIKCWSDSKSHQRDKGSRSWTPGVPGNHKMMTTMLILPLWSAVCQVSVTLSQKERASTSLMSMTMEIASRRECFKTTPRARPHAWLVSFLMQACESREQGGPPHWIARSWCNNRRMFQWQWWQERNCFIS